MSLDCDSNLLQLYRADKLPCLVKYLEQSVRTYEVYALQLAKRRSEGDIASAASAAATEEAVYVHRLSHLLPVEVWGLALVTFRGPGVK
jgi:hypothetical protein